MSFDLIYRCNDCSNTITANTIDGKVCPPPDFCMHCTIRDASIPRRKREPGAIYKGLQLDAYSKHTSEWRVICLFCMSPAIVGNNNVNVQKSCGCLKSNPLNALHFNEDNLTVTCECRCCGLTADYKLDSGVPIVCKSGCN